MANFGNIKEYTAVYAEELLAQTKEAVKETEYRLTVAKKGNEELHFLCCQTENGEKQFSVQKLALLDYFLGREALLGLLSLAAEGYPVEMDDEIEDLKIRIYPDVINKDNCAEDLNNMLHMEIENTEFSIVFVALLQTGEDVWETKPLYSWMTELLFGNDIKKLSDTAFGNTSLLELSVMTDVKNQKDLGNIWKAKKMVYTISESSGKPFGALGMLKYAKPLAKKLGSPIFFIPISRLGVVVVPKSIGTKKTLKKLYEQSLTNSKELFNIKETLSENIYSYDNRHGFRIMNL